MSAANDRALRSVTVVGGGTVAVSAAIAFARALPRTRVAHLEVPPDPAALADQIPSSSPFIGRFHAAIGVDELELVRSGIATHHLGTRFEGWSARGEPWIHAFGSHGRSAGTVPFDLIWARAWKSHRARPYHDYSAAAVLGSGGKFVHPSADPESPLSTFLYGLRLEPDAYLRHLKMRSEISQVAAINGEIGDVERREDGGIAALLLMDGRRVESDLFIDCSGPRALLLTVIEDQFEDWSDLLPCDRLLIGWAESPQVSSTLDRATTSAIGWLGEWPLRGRTMSLLAYSSYTKEVVAREGLEASDAESVAIRPGRRRRPWISNVLAIGDASASFDPLHGLNLDIAQRAILLALELLPGRDCHMLELREYNRRAELMTCRARDFLALHYLRSGLRKGRFWSGAADRKPPEELARTLDQFESRGRLPFHEEDSITRDSWTAVLLGMGIIPAFTAPMVAGIPPDESAAAMERLARQLAQIAARLPSYSEYLARMTAPGARAGIR